MRFRYTGAGWLAPLLVLASLVIAVVVAAVVAPDDFPGAAAGLVIAAVLLILAPVVWLVGWLLNSERTPQGRVWHNRHTYNGTPLQFASWILPVFALVAVSIVVGASTVPVVGVLVFLAGGTIGVMAVVRRARRLGVTRRHRRAANARPDRR